MKKIKTGLRSKVTVIGKEKADAIAKFDTGAKRTSIDIGIAAKAKLGPILKVVKVVSGTTGKKPYIRRPIVKAKIKIGNRTFEAEVSLSDRQHSKEKVLIGRDIIKSNFIIDVER